MAKKIYYQYTTVGKKLKNIIEPVYKNNGVKNAELFLNWKGIVGNEFSVCKPVKISGNENTGYCLYVSANSVVSSQMVYYVPNVLERIYQYFGFKIIQNIKFLHIDDDKSKISNKKNEVNKSNRSNLYNIEIEYEPLKKALENIADYIV